MWLTSAFQTVWANNSDSAVDKNFNADVAADFNGLTMGGKFDAGIKTQNQYQTFMQSVQKTSSCFGGDPKLANNLSADPASSSVFETFSAWSQSADHRPNVMSLQTTTLWDTMNAANSSELASRGPDVSVAYDWIVRNPDTHQTQVRVTITSNWGQIDLLTPSAYIEENPQSPLPPNAFLSRTKVSWINPNEKERAEIQTIECAILQRLIIERSAVTNLMAAS